MKRLGIVILVLAMMLLSLGSCKEGCKDPKALNYDGAASSENGSCLYCNDASYSQSGSFILNDTYTSAHYGQPLFDLRLYNQVTNITGNGCKTIGKTPATTNLINATLVNKTGYTITTNFSVYHFDINGTQDINFSSYYFSNGSSYLTIAPHDSAQSVYAISSFNNQAKVTEGSVTASYSYVTYN